MPLTPRSETHGLLLPCALPCEVAVNPAGTFAYVTNADSNSVSVIAL